MVRAVPGRSSAPFFPPKILLPMLSGLVRSCSYHKIPYRGENAFPTGIKKGNLKQFTLLIFIFLNFIIELANREFLPIQSLAFK